MLDKRKIADKLIALRGATPREIVASECKISLRALISYETAARIPRDEVKIRIANYYGQDVRDIFFTQ